MKQWIFMVVILMALTLLFCSQKAHAQLAAHIDVIPGPANWTYTLFNDELTSSPNFITSFFLQVSAPITVTGTPTGWDLVTDNSSYVFWSNTDSQLPYPNDIAPGASLGGFEIQSNILTSQPLEAHITGWDHNLDQPGTGVSMSVLAPAIPAVPEASTTVSSGLLLALGIGGLVLVSRRKKKGD